MSDADEKGADALPELPEDALLDVVEEPKKKPEATPAPIEDLPDDIEMLSDDIEELPAEIEELALEELEPIEEEKPAPPPPPPVAKPAPKPVAKTPAKPIAKAPAKAVAAPAQPATAGTAGTPAAAGEGGAKKSQEQREAEKKERELKKKQELDRAAGRTGQKRELDQAPLILRKASLIMGAAAILPFATVATELWPMIFLGKALILASGWVFHQAHVFKHEGKAPGFIAALEKAGQPVVYGVWAVIALAGLWNFGDTSVVATKYGLAGTMAEDFVWLGILAEKIVLLLCLFTYTHIYDYEHGNKFNPIFPLMYIGGAVMGAGAMFKDIISPDGNLPKNYISGLGAAGVFAGGAMAIWIMYVAMKEAKEHGEQKKLAAAEARKAAREARRGQK